MEFKKYHKIVQFKDVVRSISTKSDFKGFNKRNYSLNIMGKTLLKGIKNDR